MDGLTVGRLNGWTNGQGQIYMLPQFSSGAIKTFSTIILMKTKFQNLADTIVLYPEIIGDTECALMSTNVIPLLDFENRTYKYKWSWYFNQWKGWT